jgi:serine phosphatase RsbU (regulator of sigma subunit)
MKKFLILVQILPLLSFAQESSLDSLLQVWGNESQPLVERYKAIDKIAKGTYLYKQPDSAVFYAQQHLKLAEEKGDLNEQAIAYNTLGTANGIKGTIDQAIDHFAKGLEVSSQTDNYSVTANLSFNLARCYSFQGKVKEQLIYLTKSVKTYEAVKDWSFVIVGYNRIASIYADSANFKMVDRIYREALERLQQEKETTAAKASLYRNWGHSYNSRGIIPKAIELYTLSLKHFEEVDDLSGIGGTLGSIGLLYIKRDPAKALEYFEKSIPVLIEAKDNNFLANCYSNIGSVYIEMDNFEEAKAYFEKAIPLHESVNDLTNLANTISSLSACYFEEGNYAMTVEYINKALEIRTHINNHEGIAHSLSRIAEFYFERGNIAKAKSYAMQSLEKAQKLGLLDRTGASAKLLQKIYDQLGDSKNAYKYYQLYIESRDSVLNLENEKKLIEQSYQYQYEKQAAKDSIKAAEETKVAEAKLAQVNAEKEREQLKKKQFKTESDKQQQQAYFLYVGLFLAVLFGFFIYNRLRLTAQQNKIIEEQKQKVVSAYDQLDEKNKEITDSITYAKRIQEAILPPDLKVKNAFSNAFILYKPKDIVAGDFYWLEKVGNQVLFATADCTGHGVPGAMVSVVCHGALNRSVREFELTDPGQILDKTRELVVDTFSESDQDVKDGMDIAFCSLDGNTLKYAGANNPLWIIRDGEVLETKATKQPIGKVDNPIPFTTHTFELQQGDAIYTFSDGFVDQFGGEKGKKFKSKNFKKLLLSIQGKPMNEQKIFINEAFETWRGELDQIDDVCVVGVSV